MGVQRGRLLVLRRVRVVSLAALLVGLVVAGMPSADAKPRPGPPPLLDTMVNDQVNPCYGRPIEGGTTNGYEKGAATLTVDAPAKVSSVVFPLSVSGTSAATIQITIVSSKPFLGDPTDPNNTGSYWDRIPDETVVLGRTTATVNVPSVPCGPTEIVTAKFKKPVAVSPGALYWVVAQNPVGQTNTFFWAASTSFTAVSTHAIYIVDTNGARWLSYPPGTFTPNAIRVLAK